LLALRRGGIGVPGEFFLDPGEALADVGRQPHERLGFIRPGHFLGEDDAHVAAQVVGRECGRRFLETARVDQHGGLSQLLLEAGEDQGVVMLELLPEPRLLHQLVGAPDVLRRGTARDEQAGGEEGKEQAFHGSVLSSRA
jgi:hypothetical protein